MEVADVNYGGLRGVLFHYCNPFGRFVPTCTIDIELSVSALMHWHNAGSDVWYIKSVITDFSFFFIVRAIQWRHDSHCRFQHEEDYKRKCYNKGMAKTYILIANGTVDS